MSKLAELPLDWIAYETRRTRNSELLVNHLESEGRLNAELRAALVDVLRGVLTVRYKPRRAIDAWSPWALKREIAYWSGVFRGDKDISADDWAVIEFEARRLGFVGELPCPRRREATNLAKLLLCDRLGVTMSQLDEAKSPRASRQKSR